MNHRLLLVLCAAALGVGCPRPPSGSPAADSGTPTTARTPIPVGSDDRLQFGLGVDTYTPLSNDASVAVEAGPQGGFHVRLALRLRDFDANGASVRMGYYRPTGEPAEYAQFSYRPKFATVDGTAEARGLYLFIVDPNEVANQPVQIRAEVTSAGGEKLLSMVTVKLTPPT